MNRNNYKAVLFISLIWISLLAFGVSKAYEGLKDVSKIIDETNRHIIQYQEIIDERH